MNWQISLVNLEVSIINLRSEVNINIHYLQMNTMKNYVKNFTKEGSYLLVIL